MLRRFIAKIVEGEDLTEEEAYQGHGDPHGGRGHSRADRSFSYRLEDEGRDRRGDHRVCAIDAGEVGTYPTRRQW